MGNLARKLSYLEKAVKGRGTVFLAQVNEEKGLMKIASIIGKEVFTGPIEEGQQIITKIEDSGSQVVVFKNCPGWCA